MDKREQAFWDYYNRVNEYAEAKGIEIHEVVSIREIWDYAYAVGEANGSEKILEIFTKESN